MSAAENRKRGGEVELWPTRPIEMPIRLQFGGYCCKSPRGAARRGKFGNSSRIRMAGSVHRNSRFDLGARKLFFVPAPKIVLQQYRPKAADLHLVVAPVFPAASLAALTS